MPRSNKPNLEQQLAATDTREPKRRVVKNAIRKLRGEGKGAPYTVQVLPNGLAAIKRMARNGLSKGSIAHALGIGLDKFNQVLRDQPEASEALSVGLAGLEDELANILLEHARGIRGEGKTSLIAAIYLTKARCAWRDGGEPVTHKTNNVVIHLPDSKSPEQWLKDLPSFTAPKGELPE